MAQAPNAGYIVVYAITPSNRIHQTDSFNIDTARVIKNKLNENRKVTAWIEDPALDIVEV